MENIIKNLFPKQILMSQSRLSLIVDIVKDFFFLQNPRILQVAKHLISF